jgi:ABC-type uncharacterized transport system permease subunit
VTITASPRRFSRYLGLVPFLAFSVVFLALPVSFLVIGSFQDRQGNPTLANYGEATVSVRRTGRQHGSPLPIR